MAQVLKEEQRRRIIQAAKDEFLNHGYQNASMRLIAEHADMTVGNLYRYFANKDELIQVIITPTLQKIDACIAQQTDDQVSFYSDNPSINLTQESLEIMVNALANDLVEILESDFEEMQILILHSHLNSKLIFWFANLLNRLAGTWYSINLVEQHYFLILCDMFAEAICAGIMKLFMNYQEYKQKADVSKIIQIYLQQFLSMIPKSVNEKMEEIK